MQAVKRALAAAAADQHNAFTDVHPDVADQPTTHGLLSGVPIAVKDLIDQAGRTTTAGSAFYRHDADTTAPALARLEAAGAVAIGRTGLHEFAFGFSSENPWFGPVRNPWNPDLSPGGSSGGSAAAVAAGIVPIALGTDTGGSVRVPAAMCGIYGLKVTHGLIPLDGVFPLVPSLDTVGALADSLDNLEVATAVMAGEEWPQETGPDTPRLMVPERWVSDAPMSQDVRAAFHGFLEAGGRAGLIVEHAELPALEFSSHQAAVIGPEVAAIHRRWREEGRPYGEDVGGRVDAAVKVSADEEALAEGQKWRARITAAMEEATSGDTLVVTPSVATIDKRIGVDRIGEHHFRVVLSWFSAPVNPTGHPAISLPLAGDGRRPSVQIIGPRRSERRLLALGRRLEARGIVGMSRLPSG